MGTFPQSIWSISLGSRMFHYHLGWLSWPTQNYTKHIFRMVVKSHRYIWHVSIHYPRWHSNSQAHVTLTEPLNRPTPVGHTWMSLVLVQLLAAMGSLFQPQWWTSRKVRGMHDFVSTSDLVISCSPWKANQYGLQYLQSTLIQHGRYTSCFTHVWHHVLVPNSLLGEGREESRTLPSQLPWTLDRHRAVPYTWPSGFMSTPVFPKLYSQS